MFGVLPVGLNVVLNSPDDHLVTMIPDALGLGAFTRAGAIVATETGTSSCGVTEIVTIKAVGGAFADLLLGRSPFILVTDFYASCAVLGGGTYLIITSASTTDGDAAAHSAAVTVGTRLTAVKRAGNFQRPSRSVSYCWVPTELEEIISPQSRLD
jgi:uncharacterized membrane protein YeiH